MYNYDQNSFYLYNYHWFDHRGSIEELEEQIISEQHEAIKTRINLHEDGALGVAQALISNRTLRGLFLYCANIGAMGGRHLARALTDNPNLTLQTLDLRSSGLGDEGVEHLCEGLKVNRTVEYLDLQANEIHCAGAMSLADMLRSNESLRVLWCENNEIRRDGSMALAQSLRWTSLVAFSLSGNPCSTAGLEAFIPALAENRTLAIFWGGNGDEGSTEIPDGITKVYDALVNNTTLTELHCGWLSNQAVLGLFKRNKRLLKYSALDRARQESLDVYLASLLVLHTSSSPKYPQDYILGNFQAPSSESGVPIVKLLYGDRAIEQVQLRAKSKLVQYFFQSAVVEASKQPPTRRLKPCGCCWGPAGEPFEPQTSLPVFQPNDQVLSMWNSRNVYPGTVRRTFPNERCDIAFDDGDFEAQGKE